MDRLRGDQGSVIPEFALAAPFLVLLALGIFEFGMAWRQRLVFTAAIRSSARQVSNLGDNRAADLTAIDTFRAAVTGSKNVTINKLVIYRTTSSVGAPVNPNCLTGPATATGNGYPNACNIYSWTQIQNPGSNFTANCGGNSGSAWDHWWCPTGRETNQGAANGPDFIGVYVEATYGSYTNLLPNNVKLTDRVVMRIEPKVT